MFEHLQNKPDQNIEIESLNELSNPLEDFWKYEEQMVDKVSKKI